MNQMSALRSSPAIGPTPFWHWWLAEIKAAMPAPVMRWLDGDVVATDVEVDEAGITVIPPNAGATPATRRQISADSFTSHPYLREMISGGQDRVRVLLTENQAMVKSITLPLATEENLREIVGFELDRHTPFTPSQAAYDVQLAKRDAQQEKLTVTLAVAAKSDIAAVIDMLRRAGLTCVAIGIRGHDAFDLQAAIDKPARRLSRKNQLNLALLALLAVFAFAAIILPIWQKREAVKVLIPQAEKSAAEFKLSEKVYADYVKLVAEYNFLAEKKHATYPAIMVIEELAQTFQDTTWVQRLDIKSNSKVREVTLMGEAQAALKVIENLEQSPQVLFQNSKNVSPTTRQGNIERFHVSAEVKSRIVPTALGIDEVAEPAPVAAPVVSLPPPAPSLGADANPSAPPATKNSPDTVGTQANGKSAAAATAPVAPPPAAPTVKPPPPKRSDP